MNNVIYPNRLYLYFGISFGLASIFICYILCCSLDTASYGLCIGYLLFAAVCLSLGKYLVDHSKYHVVFSDSGVTVVQDPRKDSFYLSWQDVLYTCESRGPKGQLCLVLSPEILDREQAKKLVRKAAYLDSLLIDGTIVIFLHQQKNPQDILALLRSHHTVISDV